MTARTHRDLKPANVIVTRREHPPSRRGRRLIELLADLLDKADAAGTEKL